MLGSLLGGDETRVLESQPALLELISTPSAGVRLVENGTELYGGMLPIEPDAIPMRVYKKLVDGRQVAAVVGQEESRRAKAQSNLEAERSEQLARHPRRNSASTAKAYLPPRAHGSASQPNLGEGIMAEKALPDAAKSALDEVLSADAGGAIGRRRAPSPQRQGWPDTAEFRSMRQRERTPVARHNLQPTGTHGHERWRTKQAQARALTASSVSDVSLLRSRSAVSGMTIHSLQRHTDILQLAGKSGSRLSLMSSKS
jgi:hypothetical protein